MVVGLDGATPVTVEVGPVPHHIGFIADTLVVAALCSGVIVEQIRQDASALGLGATSRFEGDAVENLSAGRYPVCLAHRPEFPRNLDELDERQLVAEEHDRELRVHGQYDDGRLAVRTDDGHSFASIDLRRRSVCK